MNTVPINLKYQQRSSMGIYECVHKYLDKIRKVSPESISRMDVETREFLRRYSPARLKELAQLICFAAEKIKARLDEEYGQNNYVVIAVGRSMSSIAEFLNYLGVDAKVIPMSGLRRMPLTYAELNHKLNTYKRYLKRIGITKEILENNSDKKYILMDYTYYGRSLERTEELLKYEELLGNAPNLIRRSVKSVLGEDYEVRHYDLLFEYSRFKNYSTVGKLPILNLDKVFSKANADKMPENSGNVTKGLRKLFWFNVFDSFLNDTYKDCDSKGEINAIISHFLMQKAIHNRITSSMNSLERK